MTLVNAAPGLRQPAPAPPARPPRRAVTLADAVILVGLAIAVPFSGRLAGQTGAPAPWLEIDVAGQHRRADARIDQTLELRGPLGIARLRVESGAAWIESAPCPGQVCRRMGPLRGPGRSLVCVPNRISVRFAAPEESAGDVDAISR